MAPSDKRILILCILGVLISLTFLGFFRSRIADMSWLSIIMTLTIEVVFFALAACLTQIPSSPEPNQATLHRQQRSEFRTSKPVATGILSLSVITATLIVSLMFDAFNSQLEYFLASGEIEIKTPRADGALQMTVGGQFAILFWIPVICLSGFFVGTRSGYLGVWNCALATFVSLGLFMLVNASVELWQGEMSIEVVMSQIFNEPSNTAPRLPAERILMIMLFLALASFTLAMITLLQWICVCLGAKYAFGTNWK